MLISILKKSKLYDPKTEILLPKSKQIVRNFKHSLLLSSKLLYNFKLDNPKYWTIAILKNK